MEKIKTEMGDEAIILTYHENGMGTPDPLRQNGLSWRVETFYDLAQGGSALNGHDFGPIMLVNSTKMKADPLPMSAALAISSKRSESSADEASVTVAVTPKISISEECRLIIVLSEKQISYMNTFNLKPVNGQTFMYDAARGLFPDSMGVSFPKLIQGKTESVTVQVPCDRTTMNPDSLQITAILQKAGDNAVLSAARMKESPFGGDAVELNEMVHHKQVNSPMGVIRNSGGRCFFEAAESNITVSLFQFNGREIPLNAGFLQKGSRIEIPVQCAGVLRISSPQGKMQVVKVSR